MKGELLDAIMWLRDTGTIAEVATIIGRTLAEAQAKRDAETEWEVTTTHLSSSNGTEVPSGPGWEPISLNSWSGNMSPNILWRRRKQK